MNKRDLHGAAERGDPVEPGATGQQQDGLNTDINTDVPSRETLATAREDAVDLRELAVDVREVTAASREQEIQAAEATRATSVEQMSTLQQANARLVVATIEAQKLAEQIEITKAQLEAAKNIAEKANLAKSDFLSSMSHELRTPLNAILGFAQLLETGSPPPTDAQKERLQQIIKAGWYLLELINQILDLALIESGKLALSRETVSLSEVLLECRTMIEPLAQQHGIRLDFLPVDRGWLVQADRTRVKQVLLNLLSNAIKYNRAQGTVKVTCSATGDRLRIGIKDSGAGLPAEKLTQLFQSFNRLGQEAGVEEGTGIGLVVAKQLVELMGGNIGAESSVGVGSEFWFELIRDVTPQPATGKPAPATAAAQTNNVVPQRTDLPTKK